jgi:integrase
MLSIPEYISVHFNDALRQRAIPESTPVHYRKWQCKQAARAISLFFELQQVKNRALSVDTPAFASPKPRNTNPAAGGIEPAIMAPETIVGLLYGCGLRLFECLGLRVQNLNFEDGILTVHGKGDKDRTIPLPRKLIPKLKTQLEMVRELHDKDLAAGYAGVFLPDSLEKKYPAAARDFIWQWFFPQKGLTLISGTKEYRRYHLHESQAQDALAKAVRRAKLTKRIKSHTFRHSFATHLLQANYDIRTIQTMLGHSDVRSTMIYTHCVPSKTAKEAKSPLDF